MYPQLLSKLKFVVLLVIAVYIFVRCNKEASVKSCPVDYQVETGQNLSLEQKWEFVGFEDQKNNEIEYPPCGDNKVFIIFADTLHNRHNTEFFQYPFMFQGRVLINSYRGSYRKKDDTLLLSETIKSMINGAPDIEAFQEKYHAALRKANRFEIENNLLKIYYEDAKDMLFVADNDTTTF